MEEEVSLFDALTEDLSGADLESEDASPLSWLLCSDEDFPLGPADAGLGFRESVT